MVGRARGGLTTRADPASPQRRTTGGGRRRSWLLALAALNMQACMSSLPPRPGEPQPKQVIRLRSHEPFSVRLAGDLPGATSCQAYRVDGVLHEISADTIWFQSVTWLKRAPQSPPCDRPGMVFVVTSEVREGVTTVRRYDEGLTVLAFIVGLPVAAILLVVVVCTSSATACQY